jgi:chitinase
MFQDATVKHYLSKGADPDKIVLGIPTYGRSYSLFNPDSTDLGSPADGPGEQGTATREKGYLAYYEVILLSSYNITD